MKRSISVSAPGKLMLLGEHAVVYGYPCIVTAVGQRLHVNVEQRVESKPARNASQSEAGGGQRAMLQLDAPDVNVLHYHKSMSELGKGEIPKGARFIEIAAKNFFDHSRLNLDEADKVQPWQTGLAITTKSEFSSLFGFGSSSAATVCTIKALAELCEIPLSNKELFDLSYKTVLDIQGKGSGFDVAAAIYGGTLYFLTAGKVIEQIVVSRHSRENENPFNLKNEKIPGQVFDPETQTRRAGNDNKALPLIVAYSGVKADTVTLIKKIAEKREQNKEWVDGIFREIGKLVELGKKALLADDVVLFGDIMNKNQEFLAELGVSTDKLDNMIKVALDAGAYGAKLSGAGGGDCIIALVETRNNLHVTRAIEKAGGEIIDVNTNAPGVRLEEISV